jgi:hypothetical protein
MYTVFKDRSEAKPAEKWLKREPTLASGAHVTAHAGPTYAYWTVRACALEACDDSSVCSRTILSGCDSSERYDCCVDKMVLK